MLKLSTLRRPRNAGFTLVELLVVLAILGLLAGLVGPKVLGSFDKAKVDATKVQIHDLEQSCETFKIDVGRFPTTAEGLEALVSRPGTAQNWMGPYLRKGLPKDAWGNPFHYEAPGKHGDVDIYSLGADGAPGGEGYNADIGNWD